MVDAVNVWKPVDELVDAGDYFPAGATVESALQQLGAAEAAEGFSGVLVGLLATETIPITTNTPISFDGSANYDTDDIHDDTDPTKFYVPSGKTKARITANIVLNGASTVKCHVAADGVIATALVGSQGDTSTSKTDASYVSGWFDVSSATYLELIAYLGTSRDTVAAGTFCNVEFI